MKREVRILFCVLCVCLTTVALFGCTKKTQPKGQNKGQNQEQRKPLDDNDMERLFEMVENEEGYTIKKYLGEEKELDIPDKYRGEFITKILPNAFNQTNKLEKVKIPSRVEIIGESAFYNCSSLKSVTLNNALKKIERSAFEQTSIEKITFPSTLEEIGETAFARCENLKMVTLNEGLKQIDNRAFSQTQAETINIPSSVQEIGGGAFGDSSVTVDDANPNYESRGNCLIKKSEKKIISAGKNSVIPSDIKTIGDSAFRNTEIEVLEIPSSVEEIEETAFSNCDKLQILRFNEGLKKIGNGAFEKTAVKSLNLPTTLEQIDKSAFTNCRKLKTVHLNDGLKGIGGSAFSGTSIESITIPSTVNEISTRFSDAKIKVADGNAKYEAIDNCLIEKTTKKLISGGKYSVIPDGVREIVDEAFEGTSIESITIPSTVEKIKHLAFYDCKNLKSVTLNEGLKEIGDAAFSGTSIESITIPSTVEKIGWCAFNDCKNLKSVTLNEGLKEIDRGAFRDCFKLTRIDCKLSKSYAEANRSKFIGLFPDDFDYSWTINWLNG